jgi:hypothetical protein
MFHGGLESTSGSIPYSLRPAGISQARAIASAIETKYPFCDCGGWNAGERYHSVERVDFTDTCNFLALIQIRRESACLRFNATLPRCGNIRMMTNPPQLGQPAKVPLVHKRVTQSARTVMRERSCRQPSAEPSNSTGGGVRMFKISQSVKALKDQPFFAEILVRATDRFANRLPNKDSWVLCHCDSRSHTSITAGLKTTRYFIVGAAAALFMFNWRSFQLRIAMPSFPVCGPIGAGPG